MTAAVPRSTLTADQLLKLANFRRELADDLDAALIESLGVFTSTEEGLAPASGGGSTNFLRADGTWAAPPGAGAGAGIVVYDVEDYGTIDTPTNTRAAILAAAAAANAAGGGYVYWTGTLTVDRDGANSWCVDWPYSKVGLLGDGVTTILKSATGMPNASVSLIRFNALSDIVVRGVVFDGSWGNCVTEIEESSHGVALPGSGGSTTIYVADTTNMVAPGVMTIRVGFTAAGVPSEDSYQYVSYTGVTGGATPSLTGCSGGVGVMARLDPVVYQNSAAGINHTTQADPKNHALFFRGCARVTVEYCTFKQMYGDAVWLGMPADDDIFQPCSDVKILNNFGRVLARNGVSFGAGVRDVEIAGNTFRDVWTCGIDSEPQGFATSNRGVWIHHNECHPWPIFPGGGFCQAMGAVAGTPQGYNRASAARGWRVHDNKFYGWCAINNSIDVEFSSNEVRTRFNSLGDTAIVAVTAGTDNIEATGHGLKTGDGPVWVLTTTTLPGGVTASGGNPLRSVDHWIIRVDDNNVKLATSFALALAGTALDITSAGTGTLTLTAPKHPAPIYVDHASDDIRVLNNYVYDNSEKSQFSGEGHNGSIEIANYASGNINLQPAGVTVKGNQIKSHKGVHGIFVNAAGGFATGDGTAVVAPLTGVATSVTRNSVFHSGSPFGSTDSWAGWQIIMSGCVALVQSNTADTLTLYAPDVPVGSSIAWRTADGEWCPIPAAGSFVITSTTGVLRIEDNAIDCGAYADHTAGGNGIYLFNDRAGARISCTGNKIKNANTRGITVVGATSKPILLLELRDNIVWDDQSTPTCAAGIYFADAASLTSIVKLVMRGNMTAGGVASSLNNVSSGVWLLADGTPQQWTGYGAPETVITAAIGSMYYRLDGGQNTTVYRKESGTGNTGWIAAASVGGAGTAKILASIPAGETSYVLADANPASVGVIITTDNGNGVGIEMVSTGVGQDITINTEATGNVMIQPLGGGIALFGGAGTAQGAAIIDAAGGATVDAEARTAINALLAIVRALGLIAP